MRGKQGKKRKANERIGKVKESKGQGGQEKRSRKGILKRQKRS